MYAKAVRGFTLIELLVVIAIMGFLFSIALAALSTAQRDARDKRRVDDLKQLQNALNLYDNDHNMLPRESDGANGNVTTNSVLRAMLKPYISAMPTDPAGAGNSTFYYYYDGNHNCGGKYYAVIFARQMDKPENANYDAFFNTTCTATLDGEGRGGGTESYNIIVGLSADY